MFEKVDGCSGTDRRFTIGPAHQTTWNDVNPWPKIWKHITPKWRQNNCGSQICGQDCWLQVAKSSTKDFLVANKAGIEGLKSGNHSSIAKGRDLGRKDMVLRGKLRKINKIVEPFEEKSKGRLVFHGYRDRDAAIIVNSSFIPRASTIKLYFLNCSVFQLQNIF